MRKRESFFRTHQIIASSGIHNKQCVGDNERVKSNNYRVQEYYSKRRLLNYYSYKLLEMITSITNTCKRKSVLLLNACNKR